MGINFNLKGDDESPLYSESSANDFCRTRRLNREPLESTCTVQERQGHILGRWSMPKLTCSLKTLCPLLRSLIHVASWIGRSSRSITILYKEKLKTNFFFKNILNKRNASNTPFNTHFLTHSLWLVKIYMGPTKSCGSHINLVGPMWILTNQKECVEKCVLKGVLLAFLFE